MKHKLDIGDLVEWTGSVFNDEYDIGLIIGKAYREIIIKWIISKDRYGYVSQYTEDVWSYENMDSCVIKKIQ